jgi:hypothetical protein
MSSVAVATVVARNYLPHARVLASSLREHHPDVPFFVLLADRVGEELDPGGEPFEVIPIAEASVPDAVGMCFRYDRHHLAAAMKPFILGLLLDRFDRVLYLDADVLILRDIAALLHSALDRSVLLTPHFLNPLHDADRISRELTILRAGVYNAGAIRVSSTLESRRFLGWWQARLRLHCRHDVVRGLHGDQRWLDLAPAMFREVGVVRDRGCNVAYWNLMERSIRDARFFHFSGFDPDAPDRITRHVPSLTTGDYGAEASALFSRYAGLLQAAGYEKAKNAPYAWALFDHGEPIPDVARSVYMKMGDAAGRFGNPFSAAGAGSFYHWLRSAPERGLTPLWKEVYDLRPDVQQAFPDPLGTDRTAFLEWTRSSGAREHGIPAGLV